MLLLCKVKQMLIEEQSAIVCPPIGMQLPTDRKGMVAEVLIILQWLRLGIRLNPYNCHLRWSTIMLAVKMLFIAVR